MAASPIFAPAKSAYRTSLYISPVSSHLHLLPGMACMQALQEQKPATKKSRFSNVPLNLKLFHYMNIDFILNH